MAVLPEVQADFAASRAASDWAAWSAAVWPTGHSSLEMVGSPHLGKLCGHFAPAI